VFVKFVEFVAIKNATNCTNYTNSRTAPKTDGSAMKRAPEDLREEVEFLILYDQTEGSMEKAASEKTFTTEARSTQRIVVSGCVPPIDLVL
jgi:hypothetical protein